VLALDLLHRVTKPSVPNDLLFSLSLCCGPQSAAVSKNGTLIRKSGLMTGGPGIGAKAKKWDEKKVEGTGQPSLWSLAVRLLEVPRGFGR
jgi:hypothetical protein